VVLLVLRYQRGWSWFGRGGRWRGVGCSNFCGRVENDGGGGLWRRRKRGRVWSRWCCLKRGAAGRWMEEEATWSSGDSHYQIWCKVSTCKGQRRVGVWLLFGGDELGWGWW
jgi:hypothetical protein